MFYGNILNFVGDYSVFMIKRTKLSINLKFLIMKRKIKLTDKDLEISVKSSRCNYQTYSDRPTTDSNECGTTNTLLLDCETATFRTVCMCGTATNTQNLCPTDHLSKRDNLECDKTYVGDCNIPVTDKSYASPCTVDDECVNSNKDCALTDECLETEICQEATVDTCLVPNTEETVCEGPSQKCFETLINNC